MTRYLFVILTLYTFVSLQASTTDSLLNEITKAKHDSVKAKNYLLLGENVYQSEPEKANEYWNKALQISEDNLNKQIKTQKVTFNKIKSAALNNLAFLYKKEGDVKKAIEYLDQCIEIERSINNTVGLIEPYNLKASIFEEQGKINEALQFYLKSLDIADKQKLNDKRVMVLNNIGYLHNQQGHTDVALKYYEDALAILRGGTNKYFTAVLLNNIGKIYNNKKQSEKALPYYTEAAAIFEEINNPGALCFSLNNIGRIYHRNGKTQEALNNFRKALSIAETLNNKEIISSSLNNIAGIYSEQSNYIESEKLYKRSLEIAASYGWLLGQRNAMEGLRTLYEKSGDYKKAYSYTTQLMLLKDSALNLENSKAIAEMETKYQTEKKQLEIENLEKEKSLKEAELAKKTEEVKRQNLQKIAFAGGLVLTGLLSLFIYRSYRQKKTAHEIISEQKAIVEEKNKDITDSINYAKRLQEAILPPMKLVKENLPDSFILYKPKDIVAGDFYWLETLETDNGKQVFFAAADCTGHGVPGAMVSVVCSNALNRTVKEFKITDPGKILDKVRELVIETFERSESEVKDGMDISLCVLNTNSNELKWSGANNPLWLLSSDELKEIKPDKQPIGKYAENKAFTSHKFQLEKGDQVYVFTDGYADQFGGASGKKFKYRKLKELIISIKNESMENQKSILEESFITWKGEHNQVDDVCVMGVRV